MTQLYKCSGCGGVYMDPQPDGSAYFHACPEIPNAAFQPDSSQPKYDPRLTVKRPGHRDENILPGLQFTDGKFMTFTPDPNDAAVTKVTHVQEISKSPGAGRVKVNA